MPPNAPVQFDDLLQGFEWVSASPDDNDAYVSRVTGTVHWRSDTGDLDEEPPVDLDDSSTYVAIPDKRDLGLGKDLVLRFAESHMKDSLAAIAGMFRRRGAYRDFKDFLDRKGMLQAWYDFEVAETESALRAWAAQAGLSVVPAPVPLPASASATAPKSASAPARHSGQEPNIAVAQAILEAFNAHDLDRIMEFFADDCSLDMPRGPDPWGQRFIGKAAVREGLAGRFAGLPDVHYDEARHWGGGNMVASEWLLTGTRPGGEKVRVRGCDHYEFRDGMIIRKDSYWKIVEP